EWMDHEPASDSYQSIDLFSDPELEEGVEELREESEVVEPQGAPGGDGSSANYLKWAGAVGVALGIGVGGIYSVSTLTGEDTSAETPTQTTSKPDKKGVAGKNKGVDALFQDIESALANGEYGTAQSLLRSIESSVEDDPQRLSKVAEYRTRIKVGRKLREAKQAEKKMNIEQAVKLYDEILSLAANHKTAKERYDKLTSSIVLQVSSDPVGDVYADGSRLGQTPIEQMISADVTKISVRRPGYERANRSISTDGGTRVKFSVELERKSAGRDPNPTPDPTPSPSPPSNNQKDEEDDDNGGLMKMD
ncbi:MAG: PEGA domain-containing protein, partial [Bradymonadaceae bacterium]